MQDVLQDTMLLDRRTKELIKEYVPEGDVLDGIVCFFSVFADSTRVRMLSALAISEMCVTDLSRVLGINQTTVSHQLRLLKNLGIVKCERYGKIIFYSLINDTVNDVMLKGVEFFHPLFLHIYNFFVLPVFQSPFLVLAKNVNLKDL